MDYYIVVMASTALSLTHVLKQTVNRTYPSFFLWSKVIPPRRCYEALSHAPSSPLRDKCTFDCTKDGTIQGPSDARKAASRHGSGSFSIVKRRRLNAGFQSRSWLVVVQNQGKAPLCSCHLHFMSIRLGASDRVDAAVNLLAGAKANKAKARWRRQGCIKSGMRTRQCIISRQ